MLKIINIHNGYTLQFEDINEIILQGYCVYIPKKLEKYYILNQTNFINSLAQKLDLDLEEIKRRRIK